MSKRFTASVTGYNIQIEADGGEVFLSVTGPKEREIISCLLPRRVMLAVARLIHKALRGRR